MGAGSPLEEVERVQPAAAAATDELAEPPAEPARGGADRCVRGRRDSIGVELADRPEHLTPVDEGSNVALISTPGCTRSPPWVGRRSAIAAAALPQDRVLDAFEQPRCLRVGDDRPLVDGDDRAARSSPPS